MFNQDWNRKLQQRDAERKHAISKSFGVEIEKEPKQIKLKKADFISNKKPQPIVVNYKPSKNNSLYNKNSLKIAYGEKSIKELINNNKQFTKLRQLKPDSGQVVREE